MEIQTTNPATEQTLATYATQSRDAVMETAARAASAQHDWREVRLADRCALVRELAGVLRAHADEWARLITLEMGKPLAESRAEIEKCAWMSEVYAERSAEWLAEEEVDADGLKHRVVFEPLGVVLSIMPWNFPFWQALRFAVPGLVAGNTSLLKHASNVTGCGLAIGEAFKKAGFPENVFTTILPDYETVADLIASDLVSGVSLTGSTGVGARVAELAGRNLKKCVLELGGSDPFIVLEDCDLDFTVQGAVTGRMLANGQSCIASKRFIVHRDVAGEFTTKFAERMAALNVGDPVEEGVQVGPVVNAAALEELEGQIADAVAKGARVECGGTRLDRPGFFLPPTVVSGVTPDMKLAGEEVFGPVAPVLVVDGEDEAVRLANDSEFGLGGSVWTRDLERGERLARRVESGTLFVNSFTKSDPRMPFGGIKKSGLGRELSKYGLREFVNVKGISVYGHG
jgi:succinate-semialdehyde dehydrogenase/glutarate-semialdehyde dehydrogenase